MHGLNDSFHNTLVYRLGNNGCRTICTHASRVWSLVAIVGSLVVLARWKGSESCPVHHDQHAGFLSWQKSLQQHEAIALDGSHDEGTGFFPVFGHDHPFASSEDIAFHHPRLSSEPVQGGFNIRRCIETLIRSRRNTCSLHRLLGMKFGPLKMSQRRYRTKTGHAACCASIRQPIAQRCFWTHDDQISTKFL